MLHSKRVTVFRPLGRGCVADYIHRGTTSYRNPGPDLNWVVPQIHMTNFGTHHGFPGIAHALLDATGRVCTLCLDASSCPCTSLLTEIL